MDQPLATKKNAQATPMPSGRRQLLADFGPVYAANGFVSWLFAVSAPVAIILSVGSSAHLSEREIASWIFAVFVVNGVITVAMSWMWRQPLVLLWTIPGAVLVGQSMSHLTFAEVIGAYYATALLIFVVGVTGLVKRAMHLLPMPIVMGMVAGVFMRFGLELVRSVFTDAPIAGPMLAVWLALTALPRWGRLCPPIIGALVVGAGAAIVLGRFNGAQSWQIEVIRPMLHAPAWSLPAMIELVVPLAITVIAIQNGQGFAVLRAARHDAPVNAITMACGIGSAVAALFGGISTCLTGPANAIVVAGGERNRHYTAAMLVGLLAILFGLLAPSFVRLLLISPKSLVTSLAGLAMLRVLQASFTTAFRERFTLGALTSFLVTVADVPLLNVGAAFWGLVAGTVMAFLLERSDFASAGEKDS